MTGLSEFHANAGKGFKDKFWEGFSRPKTLSNAVQHFAAGYPNADKKTKTEFAHAIVEDCIIMKKVDERKLMELVDSELLKTNATEAPAGGTDRPVTPDVGKLSVFQADRMDGGSFQELVAEILRRTGYTDVEVTGRSGDQGGDMLATKDGKRIVIQAKRYSIDRKVSNSAVQEAYGAKAYYDADVGTVITNTLYTKGAKDLARKTGITLWDRQDLRKFIARYNEGQDD